MPVFNEKFQPNEKQRECIENINGKYMVLAGPGTGKTYTVTQRIKHLIENGVAPDKILCLTFTDAAANEMRTRIEKELNRQSVNVDIYTYHGFCLDIIESNPEVFEFKDNVKVITTSISRALIKECIDELHPKFFRTEKNDPYYFIDTIKSRIENIKRNRITKEEYFENIEKNQDWRPYLNNLEEKLRIKREKGDNRTKTDEGNIEKQIDKINKAIELWDFYELYQEKMQKKHFVDFNDMISLVLDKFENDSAFLHVCANKWKYILVDEYQDTNKAQNSIIFELAHALDSGNVFVVGDDDQIIYSFQGARLDTMEKFLKEFPETKVICLTENMRSTQNILDAARKIAEQDGNRLEINQDFAKYGINKSLTAKNTALQALNIPVRCYKYADNLQEYTEIASEIEQIVNSSECPQDENRNKKLNQIAILTRTNAELETFAELLKSRNIPYELKDGKNIFTIKSSTVLYYYLQALVNPELHSDKIFKILLSEPFNINPHDYAIISQNRSKEKSFIESLKAIKYDEFTEGEKIRKFILNFEYLKRYSANESLKSTVMEAGSKTGIFDYYLNSEINRCENIAGLKKLVDEAGAFTEVNKSLSLEDFIEYLDVSLEDNIEIFTEKAPVAMNAVQLSTYYSAKGKEYEYVYMPTLLEDKWEKDKKSNKPDIPLSPDEFKNDDELKAEKFSDRVKVMYVGMTRAKKFLRLSYPKTVNGKIKNPSELIVNIQNMLEGEAIPFEYNENTFWEEVTKSIVKRSYDYKGEFSNYLDSVISQMKFSPTRVNAYIKCPRKYLYSFVLGLDAQFPNVDSLSFGSAVHEACQFLIDNAKKIGSYPSKTEFIEVFKRKLNELTVSTYEQRQNLIGRGEKALDKFYNYMIDTPVSELHTTEMEINYNLDGLDFKGFIDRVDKAQDGSFRIYDYKTGKAKRSGDICEGGEHEDYYNQIGLYKFFFEKSTGHKVSETIFVFPEDYTKNLTLNLTEEDCNKILEKFKSAIDKIKKHEFEPNKSKDNCRYCPFKDFCNLEII